MGVVSLLSPFKIRRNAEVVSIVANAQKIAHRGSRSIINSGTNRGMYRLYDLRRVMSVASTLTFSLQKPAANKKAFGCLAG